MRLNEANESLSMNRRSTLLKKVWIISVIAVLIISSLSACAAKKSEDKTAAEKEDTSREAKEDAAHITVGVKGSEITIVKEGEPYIESGAYGIDDRTGAIKTYETSGKVNSQKPGEYTVEYKFKSGKGEKSIKRTVKVVRANEYKANTGGIPVLMYHFVYNDNDVPANLNSNYIKDTDLDAHINYLKSEDYYFPSYKELRAYVDGKISLPEKSVILSFDDGQAGFLAYGIPLLEKHKIPATSFFIGVRDGEGVMRSNASRYLSYQSHSYDMHRAGGNIGHGGRISAMQMTEIRDDLKAAADLVANNEAFAYPFGDVTDDAREAVRQCEIDCAFTTEYGKVHPGMDFTILPRIRVQGTNSLEAFIGSL